MKLLGSMQPFQLTRLLTLRPKDREPVSCSISPALCVWSTILAHPSSSFSVTVLAVLNAGQSLIITAGLVGCMILSAQQVADAWTGDDPSGSLSENRSQSGVDILMNAAVATVSNLLGTTAEGSQDKNRLTTGDFVMIQGFILQLFAPLMALGMYYMQLRQAIVDVEGLMELLETEPDVVDVSFLQIPPPCGFFFTFRSFCSCLLRILMQRISHRIPRMTPTMTRTVA